jgi:hypothetical protein
VEICDTGGVGVLVIRGLGGEIWVEGGGVMLVGASGVVGSEAQGGTARVSRVVFEMSCDAMARKRCYTA